MKYIPSLRINAALVFVLILLVPMSPSRAQAEGDRLLGVWTDEERTMDVEITRCGTQYCAFIKSVRRDGEMAKMQFDERNPDPSLRDRPLTGLQIISGLSRVDEEHWSGGKMYVPKKGIEVAVSLRLRNTNELEMRVRKLFLRRTATWTRVPSDSTE